MNRPKTSGSRSCLPPGRHGFWSLWNLWIWAWPWIAIHTPVSAVDAAPQNDSKNAPEIRREPVERMTSVLIKAILDRHHATRQWEPGKPPSDQSAQPTGRTAIAVLALLESGMPVQTPQITAAIDWLNQTPADGTYAIAARLMVLTRLNDQFLPAAQVATRQLLERFSIQGGGWDYGPAPRATFVDQSLTQFATQALRDASGRGIAIPNRLFEIVRRRFLARQGHDGGWGYRDLADPTRGSMTAAGLATLAICHRVNPGSSSDQAQTRTAIGAAIGWLDRHFDADSNPGCDRWHLYWIHSLERAARATGIRRFGGHDWYSACATSIRHRLFAKDGPLGVRIRGRPRIERLAFALFVLQRGLEPIAFTCFDSTGETPTQDLLGDAVAVISDTLEQPVSWTRVDLDDSAEAWSRAPVLLVRGGSRSAWIQDPESIPSKRIFDHAAAGGLVIAIPASGRSGDRKLLQERLRAMFDAHTSGLSMEPIDDADVARRIAGRWRTRADQLRSPIRRWMAFPHSAMTLGTLGTSGHRAKTSTAIMLAGLCLEACNGRIASRLAPESTAANDLAPTLATRRLRHAGDWNPEPGMLGRWTAFAKSLSEADRAVAPGIKVAWLTGGSTADANHLDLPTAALELDGEVLIVEALSSEFARGFIEKATEAGWRMTLPPKGCPVGSAGIRIEGRLAGVLIDAAPARFLFRGPSPGGIKRSDLESIHLAIQKIHTELAAAAP
jgi:hypothetical protein